MGVYTVSQITAYMKHMFEQDFALSRVSIKGEVSNCKYHSSGHLYFTLKDPSCCIACVMFAASRSRKDIRLKDGMEIIADGAVRIFERDGKYQLYVAGIREEGVGRLYRLFEERKAKLEEMGLFSPIYKQPIPRYARRVGIVTADTGAAIRDIINIAQRRNPCTELILCPAQVQGFGAAESIVSGIERLDRMGLDCIIVTRGGGSVEDLWAFNEENVAQAIFDCETPVISAVGHETDFTIADFVADLRAPTPSAAAELAVFDLEQFNRDLRGLGQSLLLQMRRKLKEESDLVEKQGLKLRLMHPQERLHQKKEALASLEKAMVRQMREEIARYERRVSSEELIRCMEAYLQRYRHNLSLSAEKLNALSPLSRLSAGYAYVTDEKNHRLESAAAVSEGDLLLIHLKDGRIAARAEDIRTEL